MNISSKIDEIMLAYDPYNGDGAKYIVMDDESYFTLKMEVYGSFESALEFEVEEVGGLKVFHNNIGHTFIDVA